MTITEVADNSSSRQQAEGALAGVSAKIWGELQPKFYGNSATAQAEPTGLNLSTKALFNSDSSGINLKQYAYHDDRGFYGRDDAINITPPNFGSTPDGGADRSRQSGDDQPLTDGNKNPDSNGPEQWSPPAETERSQPNQLPPDVESNPRIGNMPDQWLPPERSGVEMECRTRVAEDTFEVECRARKISR